MLRQHVRIPERFVSQLSLPIFTNRAASKDCAKCHFSPRLYSSSADSQVDSTIARPPVGHNIISPWLFQFPPKEFLLNKRHIPKHIQIPYYATSKRAGYPRTAKKQTNLSDPTRIERMRAACKLAKRTLNYLGQHVKAGVTTDALDQIAFDFITGHAAYPSPLMYLKFPRSICTSVNNVICHGIPDSRPLQPGDILNIDVTVYLDGYHGDCSATFGVEEIDSDAERLMDTTWFVLHEAIKFCKNGRKVSDIGKIIDDIAADCGYEVFPTCCGHGIGSDFHMKPRVFHVDPERMEKKDIDQTVMVTGMIFTIEPILSEGSSNSIDLMDGWTMISKDNSRSAQFEETILITESGAEILTATD